MKAIKLQPGEHIIAAVPESCAGPGWSNRVIWVHIGNADTRTYRTECIQPEDQTLEQHTLFGIAERAHLAMVGTVKVRRVKP